MTKTPLLLVLMFVCALTANAQQNNRETERALLKGVPGVNAQFIVSNEYELKDCSEPLK